MNSDASSSLDRHPAAPLPPCLGPGSAAEPIDPELALEALLGQPEMSQLVYRTVGKQGQQLQIFQRIDWQPDQQTAVVHIPITPPLDRIPDVTAELLEGTARLRITDRQRFGIRVEVIRGLPCSAPATMRLRLEISDAEQVA